MQDNTSYNQGITYTGPSLQSANLEHKYDRISYLEGRIRQLEGKMDTMMDLLRLILNNNKDGVQDKHP